MIFPIIYWQLLQKCYLGFGLFLHPMQQRATKQQGSKNGKHIITMIKMIILFELDSSTFT